VSSRGGRSGLFGGGRTAVGAMVLAVALVGAMPGSACAKDAAVLLGLHFPADVAGFAFQETTDYESRQKGLGYSAYYRQDEKWADVYVYDLTRKDIPQAYDAAASKAQYKQAAGDIAAAAKQGIYRSAAPAGALSEPGFVCGRFAIVDKNGTANDSVLCVRTWQGKFLKVRLSGPKGSLAAGTVDRFMGAWSNP